MKIFISYTMRDKELTKSFLEEVLVYYKKFGDVFLDIITNDSKDKQKRVFDELDLADKMVIIETSEVYKSEWVQLEIERAISKGKKIEKIELSKLKKMLK